MKPNIVHHELGDRFTLIGLPAEQRRAKFARDVAAGLTAARKFLPCCYLYDRLGSLLFEAICETPEYYLTRAETAILRAHAGEIADLFPAAVDLIELGSGNAAKTRLLIEGLLGRGTPLRYVPLDICRTVLEESSQELLGAYPALEVLAIAGDYAEGLAHLGAASPRRKLVLWLGSNIGNLPRHAATRFLARVQATLAPEDRVLVGIDLRKDRAALERAYDDACGVSAAFNRNLLVRINRELGGHFHVQAFAHRAVYHDTAGRIEINLVSSAAQRVRIDHLEKEIIFAAGEAIHTEDSYKYSIEEIDALAASAGLRRERSWLDAEERFCLALFTRI
jgi:dimethylhistidine N-methyltransferase